MGEWKWAELLMISYHAADRLQTGFATVLPLAAERLAKKRSESNKMVKSLLGAVVVRS